MGMTIEEARKLEQFICADCASEEDSKRSLNSLPLSNGEAKVRMSYNLIVRLNISVLLDCNKKYMWRYL